MLGEVGRDRDTDSKSEADGRNKEESTIHNRLIFGQ